LSQKQYFYAHCAVGRKVFFYPTVATFCHL
jgi:hypothetical protein